MAIIIGILIYSAQKSFYILFSLPICMTPKDVLFLLMLLLDIILIIFLIPALHRIRNLNRNESNLVSQMVQKEKKEA